MADIELQELHRSSCIMLLPPGRTSEQATLPNNGTFRIRTEIVDSVMESPRSTTEKTHRVRIAGEWVAGTCGVQRFTNLGHDADEGCSYMPPPSKFLVKLQSSSMLSGNLCQQLTLIASWRRCSGSNT